MESEDASRFKPETVHTIFKSAWKEPGTKINKEALQLSAEYLRLFALEAIHRSAEVARYRVPSSQEGNVTGGKVEVEHLEKVGLQLVLDF
ncbi:uncharacterized protein VTP21DRAFT_6701 [Calcarisporiella thermophila]|uniref:uncharacterized protein n=1 Tax=Calcarisporiella thermophila TaxID=911321 RepID=UPI0037446C78